MSKHVTSLTSHFVTRHCLPHMVSLPECVLCPLAYSSVGSGTIPTGRLYYMTFRQLSELESAERDESLSAPLVPCLVAPCKPLRARNGEAKCSTAERRRVRACTCTREPVVRSSDALAPCLRAPPTTQPVRGVPVPWSSEFDIRNTSCYRLYTFTIDI